MAGTPQEFIVSKFTPAERRLRASLAAHESWSKTSDRSARTAPARRALSAKFEELVDPDRVLAPEERARRAESARQAHYKRLALKSAKARRERAERQGGKVA